MKPVNTSLENSLESVGEKDKDHVFVFSGKTLEFALNEWATEQIAAYPHKEELIRITVLAMRDFLGSEQVRRHKMVMPEDTARGRV